MVVVVRVCLFLLDVAVDFFLEFFLPGHRVVFGLHSLGTLALAPVMLDLGQHLATAPGCVRLTLRGVLGRRRELDALPRQMMLLLGRTDLVLVYGAVE